MAKPKASGPSPATRQRYDLFIAEYLKDRNASRAAKAAGYSENSRGITGHKLLKVAYVAKRVAEKAAQIVEKAEIEAEDILRLNWKKATADVNSLIQVRRGACRFCHGRDHGYQWRTLREYQEAYIEAAATYYPGDNASDRRTAAFEHLQAVALKDLAAFAAQTPGMPSFHGGTGYRSKADPHPDCPECEGDGVSYTHIPDTRTLSEDGAALYEGAEQSKDGTIKVKIAGRGDALNRVAQIMGLYKADITVDPGAGFTSLLEAIGDGSIGFTPKAGQIPKNAARVHNLDDDEDPDP